MRDHGSYTYDLTDVRRKCGHVDALVKVGPTVVAAELLIRKYKEREDCYACAAEGRLLKIMLDRSKPICYASYIGQPKRRENEKSKGRNSVGIC